MAHSIVEPSRDPRQASNVWWGPIASERQAAEIIAWTAWSLLLLGLAPIAAVTVALLRNELSVSWPLYQNFGQNWLVLGQIAFAVIEIGASATLLRTRSWMSAVILLACCVFVIVIVLATMLRMLGGDADIASVAIQDAILVIALLFFLRLIWRAMDATQSLRRLNLSEHFI